MSHIVATVSPDNCKKIKSFDHPIAGVKVKLTDDNKLMIASGFDSICIVQPRTDLIPVPAGISVVDIDGNEIPIVNNLLITIETIDPYHIVCDIKS